MDSQEQAAWIILNASGLSPARQLALLAAFGSAAAILAATDAQLRQVDGIEALHVHKLRRAQRATDVEAILQRLAQWQGRIVPITAPEYPPRLRDLAEPPPVLFVQGELRPRDQQAVAVVGTRKCTPYGRQIAHQFGYELAARGLTVVSGLALGADAEAHRGALEAGGRTIAVLGCGLDITYPAQHQQLRAQIAAAGAVLTEFPFGDGPSQDHFPRRNRVISGLAMGVVVVEAPAGSGALITARWAAEQGREVFAVPGDITRPESRGCNELIRDGATLVQSVDDILEGLGVALEPGPAPAAAAPDLSPDEAAVYERLASAGKSVDELVAETGLSAPRVMAALMQLEMRRLVRRFGGGTYARTTP
jgi:DNA processing protein